MLEKQIKQWSEKVEKPWGFELHWAKTKDYVGKVLFIRAGQSLSLQYHEIKEETIFIEQGECIFECGPDEKHLETLILKSGDSFHIPPKLVHRMAAKSDCRIFEVSTPHLQDVVRLKDKYGRV